jgi:hypothetical protein
MSSSQKEQIFLPRVPSRTISKEHSSFNARSSHSRARARLSLSRRKRVVIKLMSFSSLDATRKFNTPRRFSSSGSGGGSYKKSNPGIADDAFFRFFLSSSSSIARSLGKFVHQFNDCRQRKKDIVSVALF